MDAALPSTRVDKWLHAVRLHPTRSAAATACDAGHVKINDKSARPSSTVRVGDQVRTRVGQRERIVEVVRIIDKRVGAPVAAECLVDHSPIVEPLGVASQIFTRDRGAGRPTKRDRRDLDRLRNPDR